MSVYVLVFRLTFDNFTSDKQRSGNTVHAYVLLFWVWLVGEGRGSI